MSLKTLCCCAVYRPSCTPCLAALSLLPLLDLTAAALSVARFPLCVASTAAVTRYAPEKMPYAVERYTKEAKRLLGVLEERLKAVGGPYIMGQHYTIAGLGGCVLAWLACVHYCVSMSIHIHASVVATACNAACCQAVSRPWSLLHIP